jgi:hypothetical protein
VRIEDHPQTPGLIIEEQDAYIERLEGELSATQSIARSLAQRVGMSDEQLDKLMDRLIAADSGLIQDN